MIFESVTNYIPYVKPAVSSEIIKSPYFACTILCYTLDTTKSDQLVSASWITMSELSGYVDGSGGKILFVNLCWPYPIWLSVLFHPCQFPKQANLLIQLNTFCHIFSVCGRIFQEEEESDGFYQSLGNFESKSKKVERENFGSWMRRGTFFYFLSANSSFVHILVDIVLV